MLMAIVLGLNAKAYENTGTFGDSSPDWVERTNIRDVTINLEKATSDVTTRGGNGFRQIAATLKESGVDFDIVYDTDDPFFVSIEEKFFGDQQIDMAFADGDITQAGAKYFRAPFEITNFTQNQALEEAIMVDVGLQSGYNTTFAPSFETVPGP